jgi:hypothetical protein
MVLISKTETTSQACAVETVTHDHIVLIKVVSDELGNEGRTEE